MELKNKNIAIIGAGNLGIAITDGLLSSGLLKSNKLAITRRKLDRIQAYEDKGVIITIDNLEAIKFADIVILAVQPHQLADIADEIASSLQNKVVVSTITGVKLPQLV